MRPRDPRRDPRSPVSVSAGSLAKLLRRGGRPRLFTGETSAPVTTADLQALIERDDWEDQP